MVSSLEVFVGEDLKITCAVIGQGIFTEDIVLRNPENFMKIDDVRLKKGALNKTHVTYTLRDTMTSDNGRNIACGIAEFFSPSRTISILCKVPLQYISYVKVSCMQFDEWFPEMYA